MRPQSLAWQTDIELRRHEGAQVTERADHIVVRTTENPTYRWGNFLLLTASRAPGEPASWIARFHAEFPHADYVAIGLDTPCAHDSVLDELTSAGLSSETNAVLVSERLRAPAALAPGTQLRRLHDEADWRAAAELRLLVDEVHQPGYREFLERNMRAVRRACERRHGAWFGAFRDGQMVSGLGVFAARDRRVRFQAVDTHPAHRRQGLASNLMSVAGEYARSQLGARTLVIVADPDYFAIDLYRSLGFRERERQVQLERLPDHAGVSAPASPPPARPVA